MEQSFGERLKKYRKEQNLTQQDLADKLGVSNKTVSRWESEGGYPDVPLLPPLARALGVTVDDLLDEERPVRTLTTQDWQNMLSFAFAIGGGVLFFLLRLFVPEPVCYLGYLGCMAYGVYLQRYYSYHSRWFRWGNLVMNFFVNLNLTTFLIAWAFSVITLTAASNPLLITLFTRQTGYAILGGILLAAILTGITAYLVERWGVEKTARLTIGLRRLTPRWSAPALSVLILLGFWMCYALPTLPRELYLAQGWLYWCLLAALTVLCVLLFCKKGFHGGLIPTVALALGGLALPRLMAEYALLRDTNEYMAVTENLGSIYPRFLRPTIGGMIVGGVLVLLCLLLALLKIKQKETGK